MKVNMGDYVAVTKLGESDSPVVAAAEKNEWVDGELNPGMSTPTGYDIKGTIYTPPQEGMSFCVLRTERRGVKADGIFQTSLVKNIEDTENGCVVCTENSRYQVVVLQEAKLD